MHVLSVTVYLGFCSLVYVCVLAILKSTHRSHDWDGPIQQQQRVPNYFAASPTCRGPGQHPTHGCCWWAASEAGCDRLGQSGSTRDPEAPAASLCPVRKNLPHSQADEDGNEWNNWTPLVAECLSYSTGSDSIDLGCSGVRLHLNCPTDLSPDPGRVSDVSPAVGQLSDAVVDGHAAPALTQVLLCHLHPTKRSNWKWLNQRNYS